MSATPPLPGGSQSPQQWRGAGPVPARTAWDAHAGDGPAGPPSPVTLPQQTGPTVPQPVGRRRLRTWVLIGVATIGFSVSALTLASVLGAELGLVTTLFAILVAAIPLGIVIPTFLWLDRFEAEPTRYLLFAFGWGALVAAAFAAFTNSGAIAVVEASTDPDTAMVTTAVVVAPFVEEAAKGVLVLIVWWFLRREFDGIVDGMVYAGICAAGFAFTENILYLGRAYTEGGGQMLASTFILRCLFSPFAHPMFTVLTGIGVGIAATSTHRVTKFLAPVGGYLLAVMCHSLWNLTAIGAGQGIYAIYLLVDVPIFIGFLLLIGWARRREGRLIGQFLSPYAAAGWLAPTEVTMLSSMSRRREARIWARVNGGRGGLEAMRGFQDAASELALLRRRMYIDKADPGALSSERRLLDTLVARRRQFLGQPVG